MAEIAKLLPHYVEGFFGGTEAESVFFANLNRKHVSFGLRDADGAGDPALDAG